MKSKALKTLVASVALVGVLASAASAMTNPETRNAAQNLLNRNGFTTVSVTDLSDNQVAELSTLYWNQHKDINAGAVPFRIEQILNN